jgi:hypothetical protein
MSSADRTAGSPDIHPESTSWEVDRRVETWAGEVRVNLIRLVVIIAFYGHHLVNAYFFRDDAGLTSEYNTAVTALVLAWSCSVVFLHFCLAQRWMPPWLKYAAILWDVLMVTALLALPGAGGVKSPLAVLYFLVIASAPLRLSLRLVYVATLACMVGYLFLLGYQAYYLVGYEKYYATSELRIPRTTQITFLLALGGAGLLAGQVVRQARRLASAPRVIVEKH